MSNKFGIIYIVDEFCTGSCDPKCGKPHNVNNLKKINLRHFDFSTV